MIVGIDEKVSLGDDAMAKEILSPPANKGIRCVFFLLS